MKPKEVNQYGSNVHPDMKQDERTMTSMFDSLNEVNSDVHE